MVDSKIWTCPLASFIDPSADPPYSNDGVDEQSCTTSAKRNLPPTAWCSARNGLETNGCTGIAYGGQLTIDQEIVRDVLELHDDTWLYEQPDSRNHLDVAGHHVRARSGRPGGVYGDLSAYLYTP